MTPNDDASLTSRFDSDEMRAAYGLLREQKRAVIDYQQFLELHGESAIDPDVITERGYVCVGRDSNASTAARDLLRSVGIPSSAFREDRYFPGLLIPLHDAHGDVISHLWKPRVPVPVGNDGKKMKYVGVKGRSAVIDVPRRLSADRGRDDPALLPLIKDTSKTLWITEGSKKADSLVSRGFVAVSLSGVYNWRSTHGTLGDWEDIPLKGRTVVVCFDADMAVKKPVQQAAIRLKKWLKSKGADAKLVYLPDNVDGRPIKGIDDYFRAGGEPKKLLGMVDAKPIPRAGLDGDARLTDEFAEALENRFVYTKGFGWLTWDSQRWIRCDEEDVVEVMRLLVLDRIEQALKRMRSEDLATKSDGQHEHEAWTKCLSSTKLYNVLKLVKGVPTIKRRAEDFDTDPDVLNTPAGLLHLETGLIEAHSPEHMVTKMTAVDYVPGAHDADLKQALQAIPDDAVDWLQLRLGQAITGHIPDNGEMVMLSGGGNNGKSLLMGLLFKTLGEYACAVPSELLLAKKSAGGPSPEKMTLKGTRLAYIEETPEGRYLDMTVVKQITDNATVTARDLYASQVSWDASHSLFLNTNFPPMVAETDDGTWRRLINVNFPHRYRFEGDSFGERRETDRDGDPGIKARLLASEESKAAALAWMVEGAKRWYAADRSMRGTAPASVVEATREWRKKTDLVMSFFESGAELDAESWMSEKDLHAIFKEWAAALGYVGMSAATFRSKVESSSLFNAKLTFKAVRDTLPGRATVPSGWISETPAPATGKTVRACVGVRPRAS